MRQNVRELTLATQRKRFVLTVITVEDGCLVEEGRGVALLTIADVVVGVEPPWVPDGVPSILM